VARCIETAEYIANTYRKEVSEIEALGEVRYGKWEGKKIKKLARKRRWQAVQFFPSRFRFPDGEALRETQFRAVQALEMLGQCHQKETIVVVSHADLIKLILAHYLGVHIDLFQRIAISPGSVSVLALSESGAVRVIRVNDDGPLRPPQPPSEESPNVRKNAKEKRGRADDEGGEDHAAQS
jgi:probable phosphoglycerate mutase